MMLKVEDLVKVIFYIVVVFILIIDDKYLDLWLLEKVCELVGLNLIMGDIVVFESIVYFGVIEDYCGLLLEKYFGLKCGVDFLLGYSFECINFGDKVYCFEIIVKFVLVDSVEVFDCVVVLYDLVVDVGIYKCMLIKVVEMVKVMENI